MYAVKRTLCRQQELHVHLDWDSPCGAKILRSRQRGRRRKSKKTDFASELNRAIIIVRRGYIKAEGELKLSPRSSPLGR
jgi:hypothetical protein